ncbi:hypothetical protein [Herbaspirillum sp. meg3]|uniref:hypothetical protein n=1 Tax=Herbaspirillum sp. meg3 TaxID=2025949 RepID=UPI0012FD140F|nr:hypothetical protein [Herbaspirillum sp. meg3]
MRKLDVKNVIFVEPRTDKANELKLRRPDWAPFVSADTLRGEELTINNALPSWEPKVRASFADSFINVLKEDGYSVTRLTYEQYTAQTNPPITALVVSSYIEPGFIYKTLGSDMYKPYVLVAIGISENKGRDLYRKTFVATDRPFNILMTHEPASTPYEFPSIKSLYGAPERALEALSELSSQLGKKLAINTFHQ